MKIIKNYWDSVILFITWLVITIFNLNGYWMLVDDGEGVVFVRTLVEKISSMNIAGFISMIFETNGRFRPVYWFYQMIVWLIGGNSYQFHHFAHMVVIGAGMFLIYLIIKEITKSKMLSFFGSLFFLLSPLNTENIFRLGPQEPLLVVLIGVLFLLLIKNKRVLFPSVVLIMAIFTKETSVALFPIIFFYFIYTRKLKIINNKKQAFCLLVATFFAAFCLILITLLRRGGYSTNYGINFAIIIANFAEYFKELVKNMPFIFPLIPFIYVVRSIVRLLRKKPLIESKIDLFQFVFFCGFLLFLGIQLPWKYALVRYLMPTGFFLILFSFIEIYQDFIVIKNIKLIKTYKQIIGIFITGLCFYVFSLMAFDLVSKTLSSVNNYTAFKKMASYPKNEILLLNMQKTESTIELVYETRIHLSEFWNRGDINVEYLDIQNLPNGKYVIVDSDQFLRAVPRDVLNKKFANKFAFVENNQERLIITTPVELIKQGVKKIVLLILYKQPFTSDGIYTYFHGYNSWYFYHEE